MSDASDSPRRTLAIENRDLRQQLSEAQDKLVEMAIDAGHLHARIATLQDELCVVRADRDASRVGAARRTMPAALSLRLSTSNDELARTATSADG